MNLDLNTKPIWTNGKQADNKEKLYLIILKSCEHNIYIHLLTFFFSFPLIHFKRQFTVRKMDNRRQPQNF